MNTTALTRHYDQLQPLERFQLLWAAKARGDEVERDRLLQSAPSITLCAPHHRLVGEALVDLAQFHFLKLMEIAADYLVAYAEAVHAQPQPGMLPWGEALEQGYLFQAYLGGWRKFCADLQLEPELLWQTLPGYETFQWAKELSSPAPGRRWPAAFDADELAHYWAQQELGDLDAEVEPERLARYRPETVQSVAATLHQFWKDQSPRFQG
jgi:hypothetical protein